MPSNALVDEDTSPTQNSAISMGGTAGSNAAGTWTQGESVVVQLTRPLLFEGERVTVQIVDSEANSLVMDRTVRIQDTKRFQFSPDGGATIVDGTAPDGNVSINDSVNVSDGTLGDLPDSVPTQAAVVARPTTPATGHPPAIPMSEAVAETMSPSRNQMSTVRSQDRPQPEASPVPATKLVAMTTAPPGATPRCATAATPTARPLVPAAVQVACPATTKTVSSIPILASSMLAVAVEAAAVPAGTATPVPSALECSRHKAAILRFSPR